MEHALRPTGEQRNITVPAVLQLNDAAAIPLNFPTTSDANPPESAKHVPCVSPQQRKSPDTWRLTDGTSSPVTLHGVTALYECVNCAGRCAVRGAVCELPAGRPPCAAPVVLY